MVFLTSLDILDTGFLTQTSRSNQLSSADRVNSGSALRLKAAHLNLESSSNLDKSVSPSNTTTDIHPWISNNPDTFTLKILINRSNIDTNNPWSINDVALVTHLFNLPKTKGFKAMYYPVKNSAGSNSRNRDSQITYLLGSADTSEDQGDINITLWDGSAEDNSNDLTDVNYLCVRFESCNMQQVPKNALMVTLTGVITS